VPGGRLVFDSRDPGGRHWERWNPHDSRRRISLPDGGSVDAWTEVTSVRDDLVSFTQHYDFDDGEKLISSADMRFRSEQAIRDSVESAGVHVQQIDGGWDRKPVPAAEW